MTYVMSDLHGNYDLYQAMLKKINFSDDDTLYILGDVVDRGDKPVEILLDMMNRPNVKPFLGNHEVMMLNSLLDENINSLEDAEELAKYKSAMDNWFYNGCETTLEGFLKLSKEDRKKILDYVQSFPLVNIVTVGNANYFLAHTMPSMDRMADFSSLTVDDFTWGEVEYDKEYFEKAYLVTGHTPTSLIRRDIRGQVYRKHKHIAIDCGAFFTGILGCVCLDTQEAFYASLWEGCSFEDIFREISGIEEFRTDVPICTILDVDPNVFHDFKYADLDISMRAFNYLSRFLNPPLAGYDPEYEKLSCLYEMSLDEYKRVKKLGNDEFAEVLKKLVHLANKIKE